MPTSKRYLAFAEAVLRKPSHLWHPVGTHPFVRLSRKLFLDAKSDSITNAGPFSHCPGLARSPAILPVAMEEASTLLSTIEPRLSARLA